MSDRGHTECEYCGAYLSEATEIMHTCDSRTLLAKLRAENARLKNDLMAYARNDLGENHPMLMENARLREVLTTIMTQSDDPWARSWASEALEGKGT